MPALDNRYDPNQAEVAAEVIDGEAILINLSSGVYYSLDKAGGLAWELIAAGRSLAEVAGALAERYEVAPAQAEADVVRLAADLEREDLVRLAAGMNAALPHGRLEEGASPLHPAKPAGNAPRPPAPSAAASEQKLPYETLALTIYRDMGDLLALDPPMPTLQEIPWKEPAEGSAG